MGKKIFVVEVIIKVVVEVPIIKVITSFSLDCLIFLSSFCFGKLVKIPENASAL